jgi:hypothetical protein
MESKKNKSYEREYKKIKLQCDNNGRYSLTIPKWCVKKVLCAEKGDVITFDFSGNSVFIKKENKND